MDSTTQQQQLSAALLDFRTFRLDRLVSERVTDDCARSHLCGTRQTLALPNVILSRPIINIFGTTDYVRDFAQVPIFAKKLIK